MLPLSCTKFATGIKYMLVSFIIKEYSVKSITYFCLDLQEHDKMALKTTKIEQENPWVVEELEEFLYFCCPECDEKCQAKGHFFSDHSALTNRPDAKTQLSLTFFRFSSCFSGFFAWKLLNNIRIDDF